MNQFPSSSVRRSGWSTSRAGVAIATGLASVLLAVAPAAALDLGGATIDIEVHIPDGDGGFALPAVPDDLTRFFNLAHCVCPEDTAMPDKDTRFAVRLVLKSPPPLLPDQAVEIWVGNDCDIDDITIREQKCVLVTTVSDIEVLRSPQTYPILASTLMYPNGFLCELSTVSRDVWLLIDGDGDGTYEDTFSTEILVDTEPPPTPQNIKVDPGEAALNLSWEPPTESLEDVQYYQVLCAKADGSPAFAMPTHDPRYQTASMLCGLDDGTTLFAADRGGQPSASPSAGTTAHGFLDGGFGFLDAAPDASLDPDADPAAPDAGVSSGTGIDALDASFICGEGSGSATGIRIAGLDNGEAYRVVLLTIDMAGNVTPSDVGTATPKSVTDFWEDYHDRGGGAEGGICLLNVTYGPSNPINNALRGFRDQTLARAPFGDTLISLYYAVSAPLAGFVEGVVLLRVISAVVLAPLVVIALIWNAVGTPLFVLLVLAFAFRRRLRSLVKRPTPAAGIAAVVLVVGMVNSAQAQAIDPYWDDYRQDPGALGPPPIQWTFGMKFGPYVPDIDSEFDLGADEEGPYEEMFGGATTMVAFEVDRYFAYPAGQLGVTGGLGIMGKTAKAYEIDAATGMVVRDANGAPVRSKEDTSFRLLPLTAGVVYRLTYLDDRWSIPIVPYGRAGLSYYLWWIKAPSGDNAEVPTMDCPDLGGDCEGDKALGASIGWQASAGISIRAEKIDRDSATTMSDQFGIEHAGFYAEFQLAKVDGFGASDRLKVGDLTWFGGFNFEF